MATGIFGYGSPRLAPQQLYYGQGTPGFIPSQPAGFGFQPQILPGMRPVVAPNFAMPFQRQRIGTGRNGNLQHLPQNQMLQGNSNQGFRYMANNRNGVDTSGIHASSIDNQRSRSTSLASDLASATPENQRMILGEHLYPLVKHVTPNQYTAKVTGMLLEMDRAEVIHLIESPDDLKQKVYEALQVLHDEALQVLHDAASRSEVGDQLG